MGESRVKVEGAVTIITGAGSGIGKATALLFSERGARLILCGRRHDPLREVCEAARRSGSDCTAITMDVTDWVQVKSVFDKVKGDMGKIDILINNAGAALFKPLPETTEEEWHTIVDTNLKGVFLCCKAVLPAMITQKKGTIVNISSILGLHGNSNMSAYSASKFGVMGLTQSLAAETALSGIRVYAVCPGPTNTPLHVSIVGAGAANSAMPPSRVANTVLGVVTGDIQVPRGVEVVIDEQNADPATSVGHKSWARKLKNRIRRFLS